MKRILALAFVLAITTCLFAQNPYEIFGRSFDTDPAIVQATGFTLTNIYTAHPVRNLVINQQKNEVVLIDKHGDTLLAQTLTPDMRLRWMAVDPYHFDHSPYLGMGNNPINATDPTGGVPYYRNDETGAVVWSEENVSEITIGGQVYRNIGGEFSQVVGNEMYFFFEGNLVNTVPLLFASNLPPLPDPYGSNADAELMNDLSMMFSPDPFTKILAGIKGIVVLSKIAKSVNRIDNAMPDGKFYSVAYEMKLKPTSYPGVTHYKHFQEANIALEQSMQSNPLLGQLGIMVPRSAKGSVIGKSPSGWVWHHDIGNGVMQLVPKSQHPSVPGGIFWETLHPGGKGGMSIWGGGY